jgi:hypothetical protein
VKAGSSGKIYLNNGKITLVLQINRLKAMQVLKIQPLVFFDADNDGELIYWWVLVVMKSRSGQL